MRVLAGPFKLTFLLPLLVTVGVAVPSAADVVAVSSGPVARIVLQYGHASPISATDWTPDGRFLVTGSTDGELLVWDLAGHIVGRATLGLPDERTVVERIKVAADGRSVAIDELYFEDMWDNGPAGALHRRHYLYRFGDDAAAATGQDDMDPPWPPGTSFLTGTRAMKAALFARTDWPRSSQGWTLVRTGGALAMRSGAMTVALTGTLGAGSDEGDRRLENKALDFERRWATIEKGLADPGQPAGPMLPKPIDRSGPPIFSPDGAMLAWLERGGAGARVHVLDLKGGAALAPVALTGPAPVALAWTGPTGLIVTRDGAPPVAIDARRSVVVATATGAPVDPTAIAACPATGPKPPLCLTANGRVEVADAATGQPICTAFLDEGDPIPADRAIVSADRRTIALQSASGYTTLFRIPASAGTVRLCPEGAAFRALPGRVGFHPTAPLFWAEGRGGSLTFTPIDRVGDDKATPLFTLYRLPSDRFFVRDAIGRYDTDLGPDTDAVRWQVSDAPFRSFPAQTFMRDYFEPRLVARLIECTAASDCGAAFPPLPSIATLNRVLPDVRIVNVKPGPDPATAIVKVRVADGADPAAVNGKTRSGAYDLRLFLNNRLVAQNPGGAAPTDLTAWRSRVRVPDGTEISFTVALPTAPGTEAVDFSAYAFNEDRVKSDTVHVAYRRPPVPPAPRRAFIVTIGIDAYDDPKLKLNFSANDANLIADRLAAVPGYDVHRLTLAGVAGKRVTRTDIVALLRGLSDGPDAARPDDIVVISFSGHGWADAAGSFYLFPADASWPAGDPTPTIKTLISSADLAQLLLPVRAAEITVVIDACHSAASVAASRFKPGPMGDAGLGQLAFDKGIRILAASQADDVALESAVLRQGLLTFALAAEGIDASGGRADLNKDGRITMSEWLRYGADRLPSLSEEVRAGNAPSGTRGFRVILPPGVSPPVQLPALFDFTGMPSPVVLRMVGAK